MGNKKSEAKVVVHEEVAVVPAPVESKKSKSSKKTAAAVVDAVVVPVAAPTKTKSTPVKKNIEKKKDEVEKKVKKEKKERDPDAPKRPVTAFFLYMADERPLVKAEFPGIKPTEAAKLVGERWAALKASNSPRVAKYEEAAREQRTAYAEKIAEYKASH